MDEGPQVVENPKKLQEAQNLELTVIVGPVCASRHTQGERARGGGDGCGGCGEEPEREQKNS